MGDWIQELERARSHVSPSLGHQRMLGIRSAVDRELRQRPRRRAIAIAGVVGVLLVIGGLTAERWQLSGTSSYIAGPALKTPHKAPLVLDDGSTVQPLSESSKVEALESSDAKQSVRLAAGKARFEVKPREKRHFEVQAGTITVTVLGTAFVVAIEAAGVSVLVEHGHVRVTWAGGTRDLRGGEQATFDAAKAVVPTNLDPAPAPAPEPSAQRLPPPPSWRALAEKGEYKEAYARLNAEGASAVRNDVGDLLLAADVARLGGAPARAVPFLERVVKNHTGDSRAPLAAFTLGRVLLDQLGRPREAATAFAQARRTGGLAEDALAREVESWSRAGEPGLARERATEYVERFPRGRRLKAVRSFGGLD
jgi:transmembrane sensor